MKKETMPVRFIAEMKRFEKMGEKTGWTYIEIPARVANRIYPGYKKSFRVKGKLDDFAIKGVALLPMGDGNFIMPVNAKFRKGTGKVAGGKLTVLLERDQEGYVLNKEMMECLKDDPVSFEFFQQLPRSHQNYFSKWVDNGKSPETKAKRIARVLYAMERKLNYAEMIRAGNKLIHG